MATFSLFLALTEQPARELYYSLFFVFGNRRKLSCKTSFSFNANPQLSRNADGLSFNELHTNNNNNNSNAKNSKYNKNN